MNVRRVISVIVLICSICPHVLAEIVPQKTALTDVEKNLVKWVEQSRTELLADLERYVEINTGTHNLEGVAKFRNIVEQVLKDLGFSTSLEKGGEVEILNCTGGRLKFADHLVAYRLGSSQRILLNGHLDTVFSKEDEFQNFTMERDGTLRGPGVIDMKGGIVVMLYALKSLYHHGRLDVANITVLLNSDEEIGSLGSRPLIEEMARRHDIGLDFEGSLQNKMTRNRKGLGQARIKVTGRESHAGSKHEDGVSANLELAHKVIALEALTNYSKKTTVNVGVMQGGEKRNTRPGCAEAFVDLRYPNSEEGKGLEAKVKAIAYKKYTHHKAFPNLPKTEVWTSLHRPAKEIHPLTDRLIAEAMGISAFTGEKIIGTRFSGGGTDGSLTQAVGLPTLDSLGLDGGGTHSSREWTTIRSLIARTKLAAVLIDRLIHSKVTGDLR